MIIDNIGLPVGKIKTYQAGLTVQANNTDNLELTIPIGYQALLLEAFLGVNFPAYTNIYRIQHVKLNTFYLAYSDQSLGTIHFSGRHIIDGGEKVRFSITTNGSGSAALLASAYYILFPSSFSI